MTESESAEARMDCESVVRAIWEYLDGRAGEARLAAIDDHLDRCGDCAAHTEFERRLVQAIAELRREHSDPERLRARVVEAVRRMQSEDASPGE